MAGTMLKTSQMEKCLHCKKKFKKKTWNQKYCSVVCQQVANPPLETYHTKRWIVFNRDDFTCQYCGRNPTEDKIKLHIDHINPVANHETNEQRNLVTACEQCNTEKQATLLNNETKFKKRLNNN